MLLAYWTDADLDEEGHRGMAFVSARRQAGTSGVVVGFDNAHPQMPTLLEELRQFDMDEIVQSRPALEDA